VLDRNRGGAYLSSILVGSGMLGMFLFMTYYLQQTLHYSALRTGIAYLPFSGVVVVMAAVTSRLMPKFGPRLLMSVGGAVATVGLVLLTRLGADSSYAGSILPALVVVGAGVGLVFVPLSNTALSGVTDQDAGVASALVSTTQQVGGSLGIALLNTIFTTTTANYLLTHDSVRNAALHGYSVAFTVCAALTAASAVVSFAIVRQRRTTSAASQSATHI
jgi:Na+/melibiose symporter-like transporter